MKREIENIKNNQTNTNLKIGPHLSVAGGYQRMARNAIEIGANTFQFFIRNPRGARAKKINMEEIGEFLEILKKNEFGSFLAHAPYTLNLCSSDGHLRELSAQMLKEDIQRMELMPGNFYNLHPGNRLKQSLETATGQIADALNSIMFPEMRTVILLETMAGKGSEVGRSFEELKGILDRIELKDHIGICMDACHLWDSGYDIVDHLEEILSHFDQIIGLELLKAFHINDSMNVRESHKDRHTVIGSGHIGKETILDIINHPALYRLPSSQMTPTDLAGHAEEIRCLKGKYRWSRMT
nr:deoxyribonuclease IV [uncultured Anaerostipes sp.]